MATNTITISSGQTTSAAYALTNYTVVGIRGPAALTGTAFTFQVSSTLGGTYMNLVDVNNNAIGFSKDAVLNQQVALTPVNTISAKFFKLVSNATEAADRTFEIVQQEILGR